MRSMKKTDDAGVERLPTPRYARNETAILAAAGDLFLTDGYDISLDEVAARAGLSKATLYNHYASKRVLLEAVVGRMGEQFMRHIALDEDEGLGAVLARFATLYESRCLDPRGHQFFRLFVADVSRFPDLAAAVYDATGGRAVAALAAQLERLRANGAIRPVDPTRTAERFFGALTGEARHRTYAGSPPAPAERALFVAETIALFEDGLAPRAG